MWLQLTAACLAAMVLFFARDCPAQAMASVETRAGTYQDTDRTTVVTTNLAAHSEISRFSIETKYLVDVISSASVDVVSAATGRIHEVRNEVEWGASYKDDNRRASLAYVRSIEHDWWSHTGSASFTQDFAHHNATLELGAGYVSNDVGRAGDANFMRHMTVASGSVGLTLVASPADLFNVTYAASYLDGYQASPYRFVRFFAAGDPLSMGAPETDPDTRLRHALTLRYNRALSLKSALRSHARGYVDSWGVASVTAGTEYVRGVRDFDVAGFVRAYVQRAASFYQPEYAERMRYMTADRELSAFFDVFAGARATWRRERLFPWTRDVYAEARLAGFYFRFFDFPRLPERAGVLAELSLGVTF